MTDEEIANRRNPPGGYEAPVVVVIPAVRARRLLERFLAKVEVRGDHWFVPISTFYTKLNAGNGQYVALRRFLWTMYRPDQPLESYQVKTTCRFSHCVNPEHFKLGDHYVVAMQGGYYNKIVIEPSPFFNELYE